MSSIPLGDYNYVSKPKVPTPSNQVQKQIFSFGKAQSGQPGLDLDAELNNIIESTFPYDRKHAVNPNPNQAESAHQKFKHLEIQVEDQTASNRALSAEKSKTSKFREELKAGTELRSGKNGGNLL